MLVGYARCSTHHQDVDLTSQKTQLGRLGVTDDRIYTDVGLSGTNRARPGLEQALAALREGDVLVVTKLDRLARSIRDASSIVADITSRGAALSIAGTVHNPDDPVSKMFFQMLAVFAEFEADLISHRTKEGMAVAKARGRLRGRKPKLSPQQEKHLVELVRGGEHTQVEVAELMGVSRATVHRALQRAKK